MMWRWSGCTAHHWEECERRDKWWIKPGSIGEQRGRLCRLVKYECAHDGCDEQKQEWVEIDVIRSHERLRVIKETLQPTGGGSDD